MGVVDEVGPGVTKLKKGDVSSGDSDCKRTSLIPFLFSESSSPSRSPVVNADTASKSYLHSVTEPTILA